MENIGGFAKGHSRREVIKGALKATAYAAPVVIGGGFVRSEVSAASFPTAPPPPGFLIARQTPPDEICEGDGLPPPVAMPVQVSAILAKAIANTTLVVWAMPLTFTPPAPPSGAFTQFGSFTTDATGAGIFSGGMTLMIPSQKIATITVTFARVGAPPQNAVYSTTTGVQTLCD